MPEQHRGFVGLRAPMVGRDHELRLLLGAHTGLAGRSSAHLVTIFGPAGSGKSRLTSEFLSAVGSERVRSGRCLPYGEGITYYAVQLILRADAAIEIADPRDVAIGKIQAATLAAFVDSPEDADAVAHRVSVIAGLERAEDALPDTPAEDLAEELRWGVRRYLERRAAGSPLVLVFEDIHWAEPGLLDLVEHLADWSRAPLFLLCLARPEFREVRPGWGSGAANATSVTLAPLGPEDTRRLIAELLAIDDLPETLRAEVVARAEGNPLYVEEFLRMLMETGRIEHRDGRWTATVAIGSVDVPPTLQGLITARLDRVGPEVKQLLQRASLAGRLFSTAALAALGDGQRPDTTLLRDAVRRDLLIEADERALGSGQVFRFRHVLIRDVAYSTLPKSERSRLHDRYGRWLEESLGDRRHEIADIVAHHAEQAYLLARELGTGSPELGRRALDLLLAAARNARDRGDAHAALNLYERADGVSDGIDASPSERAEVQGYRVLLHGDVSAAEPPMEPLERAIAVARSAGPSRVLADLLVRRSLLERRLDDQRTAEATVLEALEVARATADGELIAQTMWQHAFLAYWRGDLEELRRRLLEAYDFVKDNAVQKGRGPILFWLGRSARFRGDLTETIAYGEESIAAVPYQSKFWRAIVHFVRSDVAHELADLPTAIAEGRQAVALMREAGQPGWIAAADWHTGEVLLDAGDAAGARELFAEAVELFERRQQRGQIPEVKARLARALLQLGDRDGARVQAEAAREIAMETDLESRYIAGVALAEVRESEGDVTAADDLFREVLAFLEPTGFWNLKANAREHYARFLIRRGRLDEARRSLEFVRDFYRDPLAVRHRERIDALLGQTSPLTA